MDKDIVETRKARLKRWIDDDFGGKVAAFCRYYQQPPSMASYISQLFNGLRNFGEKAARKLERDTGRPQGWLDWPEGEARRVEIMLKEPPFRYDHAAVSKLPEKELDRISRFIEFTVKEWQANHPKEPREQRPARRR